MKSLSNTWGIGVVLGFILALSLIFSIRTYQVQGAAPSGLPASIATTSTISVGPQEAKVWFSGSNAQVTTQCASRIISTQSKDIAVTFGGTSSSTATSTLSRTVASGNVQLASTTVAYDSGIYGCGYLGFLGYGATTTITITEMR